MKTKYVLSYFYSLDLLHQVRILAATENWEKLLAVIELAQDEKIILIRPLCVEISLELHLCHSHAKYRELFLPLLLALQRDCMQGEVGAVDMSQVEFSLLRPPFYVSEPLT